MTPRRHTMISLFGLSMALPAGVAQGLEEHVIDASPSPIPLLQAPVAATVFNAIELDLFGVNTIPELALRSPALIAYGHDSSLQLRGIGSAFPLSGVAPAVALFSDGVYLGGSAQTDVANFFDLERVEVIRGPSGAHNGYNAVGGAINLYSAAPTATWQSKVVAELGSDDYRALQGLIRGPITDQFSMSVAGSTLEQSPWGGQGAGTTGERDNQYLRGTFTYHWTNLWYSTLQVMRSDSGDSDLESAYLLNEIALGEQRLKYLASSTRRNRNRESEFAAHELSWYSDFAGRFNFDNGLSWHRRDDKPTLAHASETTALSAWTRLHWSLSAAMQLRGGLRYTDEESKARQTRRDGYWDWHLGLDYEWRGQLLYATANSGHGSVDAETTQEPANKPDTLAALELGHKGQYLNNRLQTATAVYYYDLDDLESGRGHASGVEAEARWAWSPHLELGGSWAQNNSALPAPRNQLAVFTAVRWRWGWVRMEAVLEYLYRDAYCVQENLCLRSAKQWDGSLSASYGLWRITAYADNLSDEQTARDPWTAPQQEPPRAVDTNSPRSIGLRLVYQL